MGNKIKITFDSEAKREILDLLEKTVDFDGYIAEKSDATQRVITVNGEIKEDEFGGVRVGSEIFIKNDLPSLMDLSKL